MTEAVVPITRPFTATISPAGSKSLTNRALILAALGRGKSVLRNILLADDTRVMIQGLGKLGFSLSLSEPAKTIEVTGGGGRIPASSAEIFCGNSGTTIRFLAALCAVGKGDFILDGIERMRQRPIGELADLLRDLGVRATFTGEKGYPPLAVHADGLPGGMIKFGSARSSQFLSAVLMVSPLARHEVHVDLIDKQTSWPYVSMTMQLMDTFGVTPELVRDPKTLEPKRIIIPRGDFSGTEYDVEPDASNATYFLAAAGINPGSKITISNLGRQSLQGDVGFAQVLKKMGAAVAVEKNSISVTGTEELEGIEVDLAEMPDTAQTLAVAALFAHGPTVIRGLATLRVKETDRLAALSNELSKLGAHVNIEADELHIEPPEQVRPAAIDTYEDHRMAMSFAIAGTRVEGIVINNPECVNKTYPEFFNDLRRMLAMLLILLALLPAAARADAPATRPTTSIGNLPFVQIDLGKKQVRVMCETINAQMPLEFFCVIKGGQEHETVLRTSAKPSDIHFALLALGLMPGEPMRFVESTRQWFPPTGPPLKISCQFEDAGVTKTVAANRMMRSVKTKKEMPAIVWVFDGSRVLPDGRYAADIAGYVVSIVNFDLTMIDVPELASNANETLEWEFNPDVVPKKGTPVTMIIEPSDEKLPATQPQGVPAEKYNPGPGLGGGGGG